MSEDFLSRWSRRKREATQEIDEIEEAKAPIPAPTRAAEGETPGADIDPPAAVGDQAEPLFDLKNLPPIESITAATDIRPFLAPGVPPELAHAALRRAWTADPTIRDFVGLADYDWDYHQPGSMMGFGPLEMTDDLRKAVARIIGAIPDEREPRAAPTASQAAQPAENPNDIKSAPLTSPAEPPDRNVALPQAPAVNSQDIVRGAERHALSASEDTAMQHQPADHEIMKSIVRRGHGRALPK